MTGLKVEKVPSFTREQLRDYAAVSGDDNLIHYDDESAKAVGFNGVIVHGMLSMAALGNCVEKAFPPELFKIEKFSSRFRKVVYPGDELFCASTPVDPVIPGCQSVLLELKNGHGDVVCEGSATVRRR